MVIRIQPSGVLVIESGGKLVSGSVVPDCVSPTNYIADVLSDGPMGYWQLNDADPGDLGPIADSSGNGYTGTIHEQTTPGYKAEGPFGIGDCSIDMQTPLSSGFGHIQFDTTDFDSIIGAASQQWTMEIWQRSLTSASIETFFDKTNISGPANWNTMQLLADGRFNVQLYDGSNNPSINSIATYEDDMWHHFVLVRGDGTISSYVDGTLVNTVGAANTIDTSNTRKLTIGARQEGTDRWTSHFIAHAAVYDFALSGTRINSHYTTGTTNPA